MKEDKVSDLLSRMRASLMEYQWRALLRSHILAGPEERSARVRAVIELSSELTKIRQTSSMMTWLHERAIESIIEGYWKYANDIAGWLTDPQERTEAQVALWAPFVATLQAACAEARRRESGRASEDN